MSRRRGGQRDREDSMCCPPGRPQGGDVQGERPIDMRGAQGEPVRVADASYEPGYSTKSTLTDAGTDFSMADLVRGYCTYGRPVGEDE
jgi:hypothetical protein